MSALQFHDAANVFPMMGDSKLAELTADIKANGLQETIWLYEDKILDGRNRYCACIAAGIAPTYRTYLGNDPLGFVLSLNLHRRHLSSSQLAVIGLECEKYLAVEAKQRMVAGINQHSRPSETFQQGSTGKAAQQAAQMVGTNAHYIADAKKLDAEEPDLLSLVLEGEITIPQAKKRSKDKKRKTEREQKDTAAREQATRPIVALSCWTDWLPTQESADLLITDPPYSTDVDDVWSFARSWVPAALDRVKTTGRAYICIGAYPDELAAYLSAPRQHMTLANVLVWTYRNTLGPSPKLDYKLNWQAILYFRGPDAPPLDCPEMNEQFSVQDINAPDGRLGDRYHTWQKPDALAERLIRHSTTIGARVIDPFSGTGTFILAAARLGRVASGCDVSPAMLELAMQRGCLCAQ